MILVIALGWAWGQVRAEEPRRLIVSPSSGLKLTLIRAGRFEMGSLISEEGHTRAEEPHTVTLSRSFYLGNCEVTQSEFKVRMDWNPSSFSPHGSAAEAVTGTDTSQFPVDSLTWFDAIEFCNRLSNADRLRPYYHLGDVEQEGDSIRSAVVTVLGGSGYRLPTEAEWECACRAGTTTAYNSGETVSLLEQAGWFGGVKPPGNSGGRSHRTGLKPANMLGLNDMHGNVAEWCQDWYDAGAYTTLPPVDPVGPQAGSTRVVRGGSWSESAAACRSAARGFADPGLRTSRIGFRVARSLPVPQAQKNRGLPPYRIVIDLRDGGTVNFFLNEQFDSVAEAKARFEGARLYGRLTNVRIIDANGTTVD